jgi:hypothetical protein
MSIPNDDHLEIVRKDKAVVANAAVARAAAVAEGDSEAGKIAMIVRRGMTSARNERTVLVHRFFRRRAAGLRSPAAIE